MKAGYVGSTFTKVNLPVLQIIEQRYLHYGGLEELKDAKDPDAIHAYSDFAILLTLNHAIIRQSSMSSASVIIVKRQYFLMVVTPLADWLLQSTYLLPPL